MLDPTSQKSDLNVANQAEVGDPGNGMALPPWAERLRHMKRTKKLSSRRLVIPFSGWADQTRHGPLNVTSLLIIGAWTKFCYLIQKILVSAREMDI